MGLLWDGSIGVTSVASLKARPSLSCRVAVGRTEDAAVTAAGSTATWAPHLANTGQWRR